MRLQYGRASIAARDKLGAKTAVSGTAGSETGTGTERARHGADRYPVPAPASAGSRHTPRYIDI